MRKVCALFLCIAMLFTSIIISEAAVTGTPYNNFVDFDGLTTGTITADSVKSQLSKLFYSWEAKLGGNDFEIVEDGYRGKALKITSKGSGDKLKMVSVTIPTTAGESAYMSFKFKIDETPNVYTYYNFKLNGESVIKVQNTADDFGNVRIYLTNGYSIACEVGKWYGVQLKLSRTDGGNSRCDALVTAPTGDTTTGYVTDGTGTKYLYVWDDSHNAGQSIVFDEMRMTYGQENAAPALLESSLGLTPYEKTAIGDANFDEYTHVRNYMLSKTDVFGTPNGFYDTDYFTSKQVDDCNGGKAPEISVIAARKPFFNTVDTDFSTGKTFVSFKVRMAKNTGSYFRIGLGQATSSGDGGYELAVQNGNFEFWNYWGRGSGIPYIPNVWYTIVVEFETKDGTKQASCYIYDDQGSVIAYRPADTSEALSRATEITGRVSLWCFSNAAGSEATFALDDFRILRATSAEGLNSSEIISKEILGKTPVKGLAETTTPVIMAKFDQIISEDSTVKFVSGSDEIEGEIIYKGTDAVEIVPVSSLEYGTYYRMDLSGIKGIGGTAGAVKALSIETVPYSMGTFTYSEPDYDGTTATVEVDFVKPGINKVYAQVIGALYSGDELVWSSVKSLSDAPKDNNIITFTNLPKDTTDMEFKLFAWDNFSSLKPLFK